MTKAKRERFSRVRSVHNEQSWCVWEMSQILCGGRKAMPPLKRLHEAERLQPQVHRYVDGLHQDLKNMQALFREMESAVPGNKGARWLQEEDLALVNARSDGKSLEFCAAALGRTAQACATRLSVLVGMSREQIIQGHLEGTLDGSQVSGQFVGKIQRGTPA